MEVARLQDEVWGVHSAGCRTLLNVSFFFPSTTLSLFPQIPLYLGNPSSQQTCNHASGASLYATSSWMTSWTGFPPLSPTSPCFSMHPSYRLIPSQLAPHQPGGSEDSSPAKGHSLCCGLWTRQGKGGGRAEAWAARKSKGLETYRPTCLFTPPLPAGRAAEGRATVPAGGAAKTEGVAGAG